MKPPAWQRLLAPTDRSPFAEAAVTYARALAARTGAELHVLRVTDDLDQAVAEHGVTGPIDMDNPDDHDRWLAALVGETGDVRRVEAVRVGDDVAAAIVRYATSNDIDLIVMATHGRSGLTNLLMGSIAESVLRAAPCPVLTLRPETVA